MDKILDIMNDLYDKIDQESISSRYTYKGNRVPRTTQILSAMLHEDYLLGWANSLGWKRIGYRSYMKEVSEKGTFSHNAIEKFLTDHTDLDIESIPPLARDCVYNAFYSFMKWWNIINDGNEVELIGLEMKLSCRYFGGTLDCLLKINGKYWLIDFKTSNHMHYKYYLQLSSYAYMLEEEKGIKIDGCLILKLSKTEINFEEYLLDLSNEDHSSFFQSCKEEFLLLTAAFYGRQDIEAQYKIMQKEE